MGNKLDRQKWMDEIVQASIAAERRGRQPNAKIGIGGGPTRATTLPDGAEARKKYPIASGFMDYFPDAIAAISYLSYRGNEQHNPGQPLHWARSKSTDEADTMLRHFLQRGTLDTDGVAHSVKMAWRALALLQREIESEEEEKQKYGGNGTGILDLGAGLSSDAARSEGLVPDPETRNGHGSGRRNHRHHRTSRRRLRKDHA